MKPVFRVSMAIGCLALLLWGGVAIPAETSAVPESSEYLMGVIQEAPWPLPASLAEAEGEWVEPNEPVIAEVTPEPGTYEYSHAMETGKLPPRHIEGPSEGPAFTIVEIGGMKLRVEVDLGGGGGE